MHYVIPFVSAACYLIGGQWWKAARWFMGVPIWAFTAQWNLWHFIPYPSLDWNILAIPAYWIATSAFSYGEKMWTYKLFGPWVSMGISGFALGLASLTLLPLHLALLQTAFALVSFLVLKWLDDTDRVKNPWQELLRGFTGTIMYLGA